MTTDRAFEMPCKLDQAYNSLDFLVRVLCHVPDDGGLNFVSPASLHDYISLVRDKIAEASALHEKEGRKRAKV